MPVLFAAEVDRIQSVLFRASRQRQVIGGSRLLYHLGQQVVKQAVDQYALPKEHVYKSGGGSFLIRFPDMDKAVQFGQELAGACRLLLDASITIAEPFPYEDNEDSFARANKMVQFDLRRRKREKTGARSSAHAPGTAFCQASGVGLAVKKGVHVRTEGQYLSKFADLMEQAGENLRSDPEFLRAINSELDPFYGKWDWPVEADDVARYDTIRGNVAYLVADGNSMGAWFHLCTPDQVKDFADALDNSVQAAIAHAASNLIQRLMDWEENSLPNLPFLPLILAGDDVFVLLPAFYAIDFARLFCVTFEQKMAETKIVQSIKKQHQDEVLNIGNPTISAAVVFCKGSFPYHLAHQRGEKLLKQAKQMGKLAAARVGRFSVPAAIAFDFISGGALVEDGTTGAKANFQPTAGPYWVDPSENLSEIERPYAISIGTLLNCRHRLRELPKKRLEELEALYDLGNLPAKYDDLKDSSTTKRLEWLKKHMQAGVAQSPEAQPPDALTALEECLRALGNGKDTADDPGHWRQFHRDETFFGHGMPDLLKIWLYAQNFDHKLSDYMGGEEA